MPGSPGEGKSRSDTNCTPILGRPPDPIADGERRRVADVGRRENNFALAVPSLSLQRPARRLFGLFPLLYLSPKNIRKE